MVGLDPHDRHSRQPARQHVGDRHAVRRQPGLEAPVRDLDHAGGEDDARGVGIGERDGVSMRVLHARILGVQPRRFSTAPTR
jgi:hypothetical protein